MNPANPTPNTTPNPSPTFYDTAPSGTGRVGRVIGAVLGGLCLLVGGLLAIGGVVLASLAMSPQAQQCQHECYGYGFVAMIGIVMLMAGAVAGLIGFVLTLATRPRSRGARPARR